MNSTPSSKATTALLCLSLSFAAVGVAAAFSVGADGLPGESEVGETVSVTYTIEDPFTDVPNQYTLQGETELTNVRWTVTVRRAGEPIDPPGQQTYGSQNVSQVLNVDNGGDEVVVELVGDTPTVENFTYAPEETYRVATLSRAVGNNVEEFRNDTAHHYTNASATARSAIEGAETAIEEAGGQEEAERLRQNAISSYEAEDFENAIDLAEQAESRAEQAMRSQQQTQLLLLGGGALLVVGLLAGGIYYWHTQRDTYSKL